MSNTGTYAMRNGKLVKISNRIPKLGYITEANIGGLKGKHHRPFTTSNISGKPTEYRTRAQLYHDMRRYKVRPVGNEKRDFHPQHKRPDPKKIERQIADTVDRVIQEKNLNVRS